MEMTAQWRAMKTDGDKAILQKDICTLHHPGFKLKMRNPQRKLREQVQRERPRSIIRKVLLSRLDRKELLPTLSVFPPSLLFWYSAIIYSILCLSWEADALIMLRICIK